MRTFHRRLAQLLIKDHTAINDPLVRMRYGALEGWVSIAVNTALFALKIALGVASGSVALIADAIHTISDSVTSVVVIAGFYMSRRPSDRRHPFGHGNWEAVTTLIVAVLLFGVCVDLLESSVRAILHPQAAVMSWWLIGVILLTILVKEWLAQFALELGRLIDSKALIADGLHHRSDVLATAMVVVALAAARFGVQRLDGIMGVGVSLVIIHTAWRLLWDAVSPLLGEAPDPELIRRIEQLASAQPGVQAVHDIIVHQYGQNKLLSLHVEIADNLSASDAHSIAEDVEDKLTAALGGTIIAHADPVNKNHPRYPEIAQALKNIVAADPRLHSFHDLRVVGRGTRRCNVICDLVLAAPLLPAAHAALLQDVRARFQAELPGMRMVLKTELRYSFPD